MNDTARASSDRPTTPVVDVHAHIAPAGLMDEQRRVRLGSRLTPPAPPELSDVTLRLAHMDRTGVDIQVVSPWMELGAIDDLSDRAAVAFLRSLNDDVAATVAEHPDRLRSLALVDRRDPGRAADELRRTASLPGVVGVEIAAGGDGPALHDPVWDQFWNAACDHSAFVLLHPWSAQSPAGISVPGVGDIVDNPAQSSAVVAGLILTGVLDRFPALKLCIVHGGGVLPYLAGRLDAIAPLQPDHVDGGVAPSRALRRLYYDSLTHSADSLAWLTATVGADRVLLGSDFPFPTGCADAVAAVRRATGLSDAEQGYVLGGSAGSAFDLTGRP